MLSHSLGKTSLCIRNSGGGSCAPCSMAHWHQMDETSWVRNVPEQHLDLVIAELHKRDDQPPPWPQLPPALLTLPGPLSPLPGEPKGCDGSNEFMSDFSPFPSNSGDTKFFETLVATGKAEKHG
ncbi:hypothetical protein PC129_g15679 [Phytophthora cactorum]|uniref:Uncharacterized protein n=1 Tax=Phytophthora cactorum TaxID=29920 RepID=A0A329SYT6_9STRA|nr:hypothetical protein Pcac1_g15494 [Phytophthora cactorum]KAG2773877.1 hypothetical protein Pcac1_g15495 [Phytophthora cactorum]KAG2822778.1 hypothetical protein PC112_g10793 [Phytophthora cactorum]KAG2825396.1 hypothetical protein PC111_g9432 [Phytophthora cactorum]KAG2856849.1 hypothetical protein PC113_g11211 [Phytophthora cactorum]